MALYGNSRDISLFRRVNTELLHRIIDVKVLVYKLALGESSTNIYDEAEQKVYYTPLALNCHIVREEQAYSNDEIKQDYNVIARFSFFRDDLVEEDFVIEVGDVVEWDNEYYEIDSIIENKYVVGKNPQTNISNKSFGHSMSIVCDAHVTRRTSLQIVETNFGVNK